jgi:hypothetical protein
MGTNMLDRLPKVIHLRYIIEDDDIRYGQAMRKRWQVGERSHPMDVDALHRLTHNDQRRNELLSMAYGDYYDIVKDEYITIVDDNGTYVYHHLIAVLSRTMDTYPGWGEDAP